MGPGGFHDVRAAQPASGALRRCHQRSFRTESVFVVASSPAAGRSLEARGVLPATACCRRARWKLVPATGAHIQITGAAAQRLVLLPDGLGAARALAVHGYPKVPRPGA